MFLDMGEFFVWTRAEIWDVFPQRKLKVNRPHPIWRLFLTFLGILSQQRQGCRRHKGAFKN